MVAGYLLVVTEKVASYQYPPTGAPLFFCAQERFCHWTLDTGLLPNLAASHNPNLLLPLLLTQ